MDEGTVYERPVQRHQGPVRKHRVDNTAELRRRWRLLNLAVAAIHHCHVRHGCCNDRASCISAAAILRVHLFLQNETRYQLTVDFRYFVVTVIPFDSKLAGFTGRRLVAGSVGAGVGCSCQGSQVEESQTSQQRSVLAARVLVLVHIGGWGTVVDGVDDRGAAVRRRVPYLLRWAVVIVVVNICSVRREVSVAASSAWAVARESSRGRVSVTAT